jgi:anaerobic selenocysteine-containing dehydrogenase/Fe-S-cluster-containing dehydrogenase component
MVMQLALMIDLERCIGCKSCEAACKAEHGLGPGENRNRVIWLGGENEPALDFLALSCQHCERPACLRACPVNPKAISKDPATGVVSVAESRCTGCGECVVACPYGAMGYDRIDHHAVKCDLCSERRETGLRPACATVCPAGAITFGDREDHLKRVAAQGRHMVDHDAFLLGPANIFLEKLRGRSADPGRPGDRPAKTGFSLEGRCRPAVVDDPARKAQLESKAVSFPYRRKREDRQPDAVVPGGCNICFNCCSTEYHLKGGRVVRVTGNEADPLWRGRVCPKSQFLLQLYNSAERLTHPLKRVGPRGEGRFEPIGWGQALDEIAARLEAVRAEHGPEALGIFAGTRTGTLTRKGYIRLFTQLWGTPNFADTEAFCSESKNVAFEATLGIAGSGNSYTPDDLGSAELYVYMGDNQAESRPVHFGMINDWRLNNGARMIVVDPRLTVTASKADLWLPIRTGTDMALALALAYHILDTGLHDETFCDNWVLGWREWRDHILERGYSPEWAAPITGMEAQTIRDLAGEIAAADGCVIFAARGINQHSNGTQTNRTLLFLAAITGNMGRRGGTYFNYGTPSPVIANAPEERRAVIKRPMAATNPTGWLDAMVSGDPYPMRALITANNPLTAWPDQTRVREAFEALDLLVHIELFRNETSAYADYILPAATGVEKGEIGRASEDRRVVWIDRVIDPPGEAKPDGWIWIELGKRFGFDDVLREEYKDSSQFWDEMCIGHLWMRGCTQKRLHSVPWRWVRTPLVDEDAPEIDTLHLEGTTATGYPQGHRFPTPSGKLEFRTEALDARFGVLGLSALPEFYTDSEQLMDLPHLRPRGGGASPVRNSFAKGNVYTMPVEITQPDDESPARVLAAQGYDTELITGRPPAPHFHSWTHYAWQAQEMWPDLYVQIHPAKARRMGVRDGQEVTVETVRGRIQARAWVYPGIREDAVYVPIGWDASQPFHPWKSVNFLTDSRQRDPLSDHSNLKSYLCRIVPRQSA